MTIGNRATALAARLSAGIVCEAVRKVAAGELDNAIAVIRPPGHHAESHCIMGFCLFNNVAVAARVAQKEFDIKRVLILDCRCIIVCIQI